MHCREWGWMNGYYLHWHTVFLLLHCICIASILFFYTWHRSLTRAAESSPKPHGYEPLSTENRWKWDEEELTIPCLTQHQTKHLYYHDRKRNVLHHIFYFDI